VGWARRSRDMEGAGRRITRGWAVFKCGLCIAICIIPGYAWIGHMDRFSAGDVLYLIIGYVSYLRLVCQILYGICVSKPSNSFHYHGQWKITDVQAFLRDLCLD